MNIKNVKKVLMPKGTALWLRNYTKLSLKQIQDFCQLDFLTLTSLNDRNTVISNPIDLGQLTLSEIERCESNHNLSLKNSMNLGFNPVKRRRKYFTLFQKSQRPTIVAWFLYHHPSIPLDKIAQLLHTKHTFITKLAKSIKDHPDQFALYSPTKFGFCSDNELNEFISTNNITNQ